MGGCALWASRGLAARLAAVRGAYGSRSCSFAVFWRADVGRAFSAGTSRRLIRADQRKEMSMGRFFAHRQSTQQSRIGPTNIFASDGAWKEPAKLSALSRCDARVQESPSGV